MNVIMYEWIIVKLVFAVQSTFYRQLDTNWTPTARGAFLPV